LSPPPPSLKELFDACKIGDADIKYSFPYNRTNSKEVPGSGEKGGVPLRWAECLDGALVLFRLGLLVFAVCSEQERSGPIKCFAIWARRNRSYRNKWLKLALLALLVPMTTMTTPPGDGTGAYLGDGTGSNRAEPAESDVQTPTRPSSPWSPWSSSSWSAVVAAAVAAAAAAAAAVAAAVAAVAAVTKELLALIEEVLLHNSISQVRESPEPGARSPLPR
jgi:hypothetical protein